jgi:hypothetical protein
VEEYLNILLRQYKKSKKVTATHGIVRIGAYKMPYRDRKTGKFISKEEWEEQQGSWNIFQWNVFTVMIVVGITLVYIGGI